MRYLLYIVSLFWIFAGGATLFIPDVVRKLVDKFSKHQHFKLISTVVPLVVAVILLLGAGETVFPMFAQVFGVIAIAKGLAGLLLSKEKINAIMGWWLGAPELACRMTGLLTGGIGLILYKVIL